MADLKLSDSKRIEAEDIGSATSSAKQFFAEVVAAGYSIDSAALKWVATQEEDGTFSGYYVAEVEGNSAI